MRVKTVTFGSAVISIRSRFRGSAILDAKYRNAIKLAYPQIDPVEMGLLSNPQPTVDNPIKIAPHEQIALDRYNQKIIELQQANPLGTQYYNLMLAFLWRARRIVAAEGAPWSTADGELADPLAAFEHFLSEGEDADSEDVEAGLWSAIGKAIIELDTPATPEFQQPLSVEEVKALDPLVNAPAVTGKTASSGGR